jgi:hypothetical protein
LARNYSCSYVLLMTMNILDLLLSSFHDAQQGSSPASGLNGTPASADTGTTPVEDTPIRQRCLFPDASCLDPESADDNGADKDEETEDTRQRHGAWLLGRIQNQSLDIDMIVVKQEEKEEGDGDSNCSAEDVSELFASVVESASDRREVLILEDNDDILCDTAHNMIGS